MRQASRTKVITRYKRIVGLGLSLCAKGRGVREVCRAEAYGNGTKDDDEDGWGGCLRRGVYAYRTSKGKFY